MWDNSSASLWSCLQEAPLVDKLCSLMIKAESKQRAGTSMEETDQYNVKETKTAMGSSQLVIHVVQNRHARE